MAGFTEALAAEAAEFGIKATVVYPGYFRTNFLSKGSLTLPQHPIADYTLARKIESAHENQINGNQPGDPEKAAKVLITVAESNNVPVHLFLGQDAYDMAKVKQASFSRIWMHMLHWLQQQLFKMVISLEGLAAIIGFVLGAAIKRERVCVQMQGPGVVEEPRHYFPFFRGKHR